MAVTSISSSVNVWA